MTPQQLNIFCYFIFWGVFALGTWITFQFAAAAVGYLDNDLPGGCPPWLRFLTWLLAGIWSMAMFSEGILISSPYLTAAFR